MSWIDHFYAASVCAILAVLGASTISLHKKSKLGQAVVACIAAALCGAVTPSAITPLFKAILGIDLPWAVCASVSLLEGFLAYGILAKIDKWEAALPSADILGPLSDLLKKKKDKE